MELKSENENEWLGLEGRIKYLIKVRILVVGMKIEGIYIRLCMLYWKLRKYRREGKEIIILVKYLILEIVR